MHNTPRRGCFIETIWDNGVDVTNQEVDGVYALSNVTADHLIEVDFVEGRIIDNRAAATSLIDNW